jgi:acyl carrier protein
MSTLEKITAIVIREFRLDPEIVKPSATLADLGIDSLAALEFVFDLENEFGIFLGEAKFNGDTLASVIEAVDAALAEKAGPAAGLQTSA